MFGRHHHQVGNCKGGGGGWGEGGRGEGGKGEGGRGEGEGVIEGDNNVSMYMARLPKMYVSKNL